MSVNTLFFLRHLWENSYFKVHLVGFLNKLENFISSAESAAHTGKSHAQVQMYNSIHLDFTHPDIGVAFPSPLTMNS